MDQDGAQATQPPVYRAMSLSVRPTRAAVFVPEVEDWVPVVRRMLENFSRTWGGVSNILIPHSPDGEVAEVFWHVLEYFAPDIVGSYQRTDRHLKLAHPEIYEKELAKATAQMGQTEGCSIDQARALFERGLDDALEECSLSDSTTARLLRCCAPAMLLEKPEFVGFHADQETLMGLVDMGAFVNLESEPNIVVDVSGLDELLGLMVLDRTGAIAPSFHHFLEQKGRAPREYTLSEDDLDPMLELVWRGYGDPSERRSSRRIAREIGSSGPEEPKWSGRPQGSWFPLSKTSFKCEWRWRSIGDMGVQPHVIVVGDSLADYCLYMALNRITDRGIWLPKRFAFGSDDTSQRVLGKLSDELWLKQKRDFCPNLIELTSMSLDPQELEEANIPALLDGQVRRKRVNSRWRIVPAERVSLRAKRLLLHEKLSNLQRYEPFVGESMVTRFDTPIPYDCIESEAVGVAWYIECALRGYKLPVRACLSDLLAPEEERGNCILRPSSDGFRYFSHSSPLRRSAVRVDESVDRPRLRCPTAKEIFERLLAEDGLHVAVSSAGQYTEAALGLFGGLDALANSFLTPSTDSLLCAFMSTKPSAQEPGVYLKAIERRFLTLADIKAVTKLSTPDARALVDQWLTKRILSRGLVFQCPYCSFAGWYPLEAVGTHFECQRCRRGTFMVHPGISGCRKRLQRSRADGSVGP